ncbi:hypothetical protein MRX96_032871 [Rhipicephalus microplus]
MGESPPVTGRRSEKAQPTFGRAVGVPATAHEVEEADRRYLAARVLARVEHATHERRRDVEVERRNVILLVLVNLALQQLHEVGLSRRAQHVTHERTEVAAAGGTVVQSNGLGRLQVLGEVLCLAAVAAQRLSHVAKHIAAHGLQDSATGGALDRLRFAAVDARCPGAVGVADSPHHALAGVADGKHGASCSHEEEECDEGLSVCCLHDSLSLTD